MKTDKQLVIIARAIVKFAKKSRSNGVSGARMWESVFTSDERKELVELASLRCEHIMSGTDDERCWLHEGHYGEHKRSPTPHQEWDE